MSSGMFSLPAGVGTLRLMGRRLVLWDIDGTLVRAGDVAAAVFDQAVGDALGYAVSIERPIMSGKTDPQICLEYLSALEVADASGHLPVVLANLERRLAAAEHLIAADGALCPGVVEVLSALDAHPSVSQTVLTGNIAPNALVKLRAFGLDGWLDLEVGAYGSDSSDRNALVAVARSRLAERRGIEVEPDEVWVVGDTPRDLECARTGGAHCVLVGTGRTPAEQLEGLGADAVLGDLSDTAEVLELLAS